MLTLSENECSEILRNLRWKDGIMCIFCDSDQIVKYGKDRKGFPRYLCKKCRKSFTDKTKTLFEGTQLSIQDWFFIIHNYKRKSIRKIASELKKPYNTVHACVKKIRENPMAMEIKSLIEKSWKEQAKKHIKLHEESSHHNNFQHSYQEHEYEHHEYSAHCGLKNPRVLMLGWEMYPKMVGGLGKVCYSLAKALCELGVRLTMILPIYVEHPGMEIISTNIDRLGIKSILSPYADSRRYKDILMSRPEKELYGSDIWEEIARYTNKCVEIAKDREFDIIHAHDWMTFEAAMIIKKMTGKPLVLHVHTTEFDRGGGQGVNQRVYEIEKRAFASADMIIAVSNFTKNKIMSNYGTESSKIRVLHNALSYDDYISRQLDKNGKVVLYFGRVTLQKGPDYFIKAASKVLEHMKNVTFVVAGTGDMLTRMIEMSCEMGMSNSVLFTGYLTEEEAKSIYSLADVYVMPSVSEPFGITALEAIGKGVPLIVSKTAGVGEVVNHCLKVDFWDVDELANKIISCLRYDSLRGCMKENSIREIRKLEWKKQAEKCVEFYSALL